MKGSLVIVDQYLRFKDAARRSQKLNPEREAPGLELITRPFGHPARRVAILAQEDGPGLDAYQKAGFEIVSMNGRRQEELLDFIEQMNRYVDDRAPGHVVVVSTDPAFGFLCSQAVKTGVEVSVWAPRESVPRQLTHPEYNYQDLAELLPESRSLRVDGRMDFENLYIGLRKQGWRGDLKALVEAVREEAAGLGAVTSLVAYADWGLLSRGERRDLQRELDGLGVETRFQANIYGKNSADMKIADDIRTLLERDASAPDAADVIVLISCDRDFRPTVETARARQKRLVIFSLEQGISQALKQAAGEIRYLDARLGLSRRPAGDPPHEPARRPDDGAPPRPLSPRSPHAETLMRVQRVLSAHHWKWAYLESLLAEAGLGPDGPERLQQAVEALVLLHGERLMVGPGGAQEKKDTLRPNPALALCQAVARLVEGLPRCVSAATQEKGWDYADSQHLFNCMAGDAELQRLQVGQTRGQAEGWLDLAEAAGLLVRKEMPHHANPQKQVETWWLPGEGAGDPPPADPQPEPGPSGEPQEAAGPAASPPQAPPAGAAGGSAGSPFPTQDRPPAPSRPRGAPLQPPPQGLFSQQV